MNPDHPYPGYSATATTSMAFAWDDQTAHRNPGKPLINELSHCLLIEQQLPLKTPEVFCDNAAQNPG